MSRTNVLRENCSRFGECWKKGFFIRISCRRQWNFNWSTIIFNHSWNLWILLLPMSVATLLWVHCGMSKSNQFAGMRLNKRTSQRPSMQHTPNRHRQSRQFMLDMKSLFTRKTCTLYYITKHFAIQMLDTWKILYYCIYRSRLCMCCRSLDDNENICSRYVAHPCHTHNTHVGERESIRTKRSVATKRNNNKKWSTHIYCQQIFLAFRKCTRVNDIIFCSAESFSSGCQICSGGGRW